MESPATPVSMQSPTPSATPSGSTAKPSPKSAFTGSPVAVTIDRTCASIASRGTAPSGNAWANAAPALVVASAGKPRCSRYRAVPASQGFGSTKQPVSWSLRNAARAAVVMGSPLPPFRSPVEPWRPKSLQRPWMPRATPHFTLTVATSPLYAPSIHASHTLTPAPHRRCRPRRPGDVHHGRQARPLPRRQLRRRMRGSCPATVIPTS